MTLVLALKGEPDQRLDLSPLVPNRLLGKSEAEIAALELQTTKEKATVGDVFAIKADGAFDSLRFEGGSTRFDQLGAGMSGGAIALEGDCGQALGRGMSGGAITASGSAGPFAGSAMSGGRIEIAGDAGDFLGAPLDGEMEGMSGGVLVVRGSAGARAGDRMRRGAMVVEGAVGADAASRFIAGTLVAVGGAGASPGYLMRRGTLVFGRAPELGPTFVDCGAFRLSFMGLFANFLRPYSEPASRLLASGRFNRFGGDTAALGKGEIFFPA
ncbi:formylmethanofuran dehydrogenase subunit C [Methylocella sp.]|uniref:formylmethanofuran dehydrogenase subunit C n=1 Tax=Methylocella sp. TaxID=1978226 RepID=UPI0035AFFFA4